MKKLWYCFGNGRYMPWFIFFHILYKISIFNTICRLRADARSWGFFCSLLKLTYCFFTSKKFTFFNFFSFWNAWNWIGFAWRNTLSFVSGSGQFWPFLQRIVLKHLKTTAVKLLSLRPGRFGTSVFEPSLFLCEWHWCTNFHWMVAGFPRLVPRDEPHCHWSPFTQTHILLRLPLTTVFRWNAVGGCVCVWKDSSSLWTRRGGPATIQVEIPTAFNIKNVVLQGDGAGRGSFCPCGGRGQGILTPVQAHEAFQESSLHFTSSHLVLKGHKQCWGSGYACFWASRIRQSQVRNRRRILPSYSKNCQKNLGF